MSGMHALVLTERYSDKAHGAYGAPKPAPVFQQDTLWFASVAPSSPVVILVFLAAAASVTAAFCFAGASGVCSQEAAAYGVDPSCKCCPCMSDGKERGRTKDGKRRQQPCKPAVVC